MSTNEQRLVAALTALVESYDDTGCDGCGVVSRSAYEDAQGVLASVESSDASDTREPPSDRASARWVDPFEIVEYIGEDPGPLNLSLSPTTNDPIDW